jgi:nucleotide-binding universal stress UspA family protein
MGSAPDALRTGRDESRIERWKEVSGMIVVGVDGSGSSSDAIRWAVNEARLRTTKVEAVYAWQSPLVMGFQYIPPDLIDPQALDRHAREIVEAAVAEVGDVPDDVEIAARAVEGPPAGVLIDASHDAELLVLGSRGRGGFQGLLLGSVGQQCVHHAVCPVVIVRPDTGGETERSSS